MRIPYKYAVALTAALGLFMAVLDNTIVNVSLVAMQRSFRSNLNTIQWVITAYFLAQAAVIPAAGYLSNRFGLKRMFILALGIFTLGSLLCGLSPDLAGTSGGESLLIAFRVLQGIGGGMLFPLATSISFGAFPPAERAASSAFVAIPVLLAPTLGPTVGGLIVDSSFGWPWIFFINVPVGAVAITLISLILRPEPREEAEAQAAVAGKARVPFDYLGIVLSMLGVLLIVYAFTLVGETRPGSVSAVSPRGEIWGWGYWLVWALLAAGAVVLSLFGLYESRRAQDPVLDLHLFREYSFSVATFLTWLTRAVVFGSFFLIPVFLEQFLGLSAVRTGLALMPQGIGAAVGIITGSRLYDRIGPKYLVTLGLVTLTFSSWLLTGIDAHTTAWSLAPVLFIRGVGFGWGNLPLQTVALSSVVGRALPKASSLYNASAQIFSSIGVAMVSTLFIQSTTSRAGELMGAARATGSRPAADLARQAGAYGVSHVFWLLTIGTAITILGGFLLPRRSIKQELQAQGRADGHEAERPSFAAAE
ncbi:MAG: multidrug efflux MFS transporter [Chloroflexota bacterium]|nr:multidrug efflux MFS transporter [Chloroflexota bacterium]